jgi:flagellum-specific ATP synthase
VLVEGDDLNDPVADTARAILDGHVVLSRELASAGHFPAIDVLGSVSRLAGDLLSAEQVATTTALRADLATYRDARDLIAIGAYVRGSDSKIDRAIDRQSDITAFLRQGRDERTGRLESFQRLGTIVAAGAAK